MKRKGYLFEKLCSFDNLHKSFKKAFKGSGKTKEACRFHFYLENELWKLKNKLETDTYRPAKYRLFKIFDPKERTISVAPFRDRVIHHAAVQVIEPIFEPTFIFDSYATRKNKGTHKAIKKAGKFLKASFWYYKADISKYFDSVNHDILLELLQKKIKDGRLLNLLERIIRNSGSIKGLPIGNLTSQFFANVYLNPLDHFVKDDKRVKNYIRYMDDMVFFANSKEYLKNVLNDVRVFLFNRLKLKLNPRYTFLNSRLNGLPFLGFRIFPNLKRIKKGNLKRTKTKLERKRTAFQAGKITEDHFVMSIRSMFDHVGYADSFKLRSRFLVPGAGVE